MEKNRMSIHIEAENIFFENQNLQFHLCTTKLQKKLIGTNLIFKANHDFHISNFFNGN